MADGSITIGVGLEMDKFDKQIVELEKKMKKEEDKKVVVGGKLTAQEQELERAIQKTDELAEAYQRLKKAQDSIASGKATPQQFLEYQGLQAQYGSLEQLGTTFDKALTKQEAIEQKVANTKTQYDAVNEKVKEYTNKINSVNLQKQQSELQALKDNYSKVGQSVEGIIHKVGKWGLAIFSIRSAYLFVRQAVSTLSQDNEQLATQISNIKFALANILAPIVQFIVNLVERIVGVIGFILKALFNIDIFAKSTANSMSSASGSIKKMKKDLAGFDEANILGGNLAGGGGIGGGLAKDLKDLEKIGEETWKKFKNWLWPEGKSIIEATYDTFKLFFDTLKVTFAPIVDWLDRNVWQPMKKVFIQTMKDLEPYIEPLKEKFKEVIDEVRPYWEFFRDKIIHNVIDPIREKLKPVGREFYNALVPFLNRCIDVINQLFGIFGVHLDYLEYKTDETGREVEDNLTNPMENVENKIDELNNQEINIQTNEQNINNLDSGLQGILNKLRDLGSRTWNIVTSIATKGSSSLNNFLSPLRNALSGIGIKLPFLASGGIVNMPNKGRLVGNAVAGESGREGVIPLTDQQAMAQLGREIGKNVLVNLTNVTTMNGRVIGRELKQISNEQDFAYNM